MLKNFKTNDSTLILEMLFFQIKMQLIFCTCSLLVMGKYINFYKKHVT